MQGSGVVGGWGTTWMSWRGRRGGAGGGLRGRQWTAVCTWTSWHTPLLPSHTGDLKVKYSKPSPAHWNVKQHCGQFWHFKLETGEVLSTTGDYGHWWRLNVRERERERAGACGDLTPLKWDGVCMTTPVNSQPGPGGARCRLECWLPPSTERLDLPCRDVRLRCTLIFKWLVDAGAAWLLFIVGSWCVVVRQVRTPVWRVESETVTSDCLS